MFVAGDIGGTKTILALYQLEQNRWICKKKETFISSAYDNFSKLLDSFLHDENILKLKCICIGVAGPVENGDCITTNLPWELKSKEIKRRTGAKHVTLLNDLEATAWGVLNLSDNDFVELNSKSKINKGNLAILAAGTGLGEAIVIRSDEKYHVVATEGGHTDFSPRNEQEIGLLRHLMEKHPEHVSYERVLSGQGLINIYSYLKSLGEIDVGLDKALQVGKEDLAAEIGEKGVANQNPLCVKALQVFCEIYGAEAGNMALKCLPKGGVILAGGIAAKILPSMKKGDFMRGFLAKGRYKSILQDFSVKVCLNPEAALIGAIFIAKTKV